MVDKIELMFHCGMFSLVSYMASDKERKVSDIASLLKQFFRYCIYNVHVEFHFCYVSSPAAVEPLIKDTLNKGHLCIKGAFC